MQLLCGTQVSHSLDLIFGTCVVKPDNHREREKNGELGISHSVTHCCSLETAHVHRIRRARKKKRRNETGEVGAWDKAPEEVRKRERREKEDRGWKWILETKKRKKQKPKRELCKRIGREKLEGKVKKHDGAVAAQAPPGVCKATGKTRQWGQMAFICCLFISLHIHSTLEFSPAAVLRWLHISLPLRSFVCGLFYVCAAALFLIMSSLLSTAQVMEKVPLQALSSVDD